MAMVEWPGAYDETVNRLIAACERQPDDWAGYLVLADRLGEIAAGSAPEHALRWLAARRRWPIRRMKPRIKKNQWVWFRANAGDFAVQTRPPLPVNTVQSPAILPKLVFSAAADTGCIPGRSLAQCAFFRDWAGAVAFVADGLDVLRRLTAVVPEEG